MLKKRRENADRVVELLETLLVFQLHALGLDQKRIAKIVGRQLAWVNKLLKGLPKGGRTDGGKA